MIVFLRNLMNYLLGLGLKKIKRKAYDKLFMFKIR
jgi:hypothetical protein